MVAAWPVWFGGSTPARFLTPFVFPLAVMVAPLWSRQDNFGWCVSIALLVVSVLIACIFGFGATGTLAYNSGSGRAGWLIGRRRSICQVGFRAIFEQYRRKGRLAAAFRKSYCCPGIWALIKSRSGPLALDSCSMCPRNISRPALAAVTLVAHFRRRCEHVGNRGALHIIQPAPSSDSSQMRTRARPDWAFSCTFRSCPRPPRCNAWKYRRHHSIRPGPVPC